MKSNQPKAERDRIIRLAEDFRPARNIALILNQLYGEEAIELLEQQGIQGVEICLLFENEAGKDHPKVFKLLKSSQAIPRLQQNYLSQFYIFTPEY